MLLKAFSILFFQKVLQKIYGINKIINCCLMNYRKFIKLKLQILVLKHLFPDKTHLTNLL